MVSKYDEDDDNDDDGDGDDNDDGEVEADGDGDGKHLQTFSVLALLILESISSFFLLLSSFFLTTKFRMQRTPRLVKSFIIHLFIY